MDTFNFSFFEDKPQESEKKADNTASTPSPASSESEAQTEIAADDDPFGFGAFDTNDLSASAPVEPPAPVETEDDFDLDSLSSFSLDEPDDEFPDIALVPSDADSSSSPTPPPTEMDLDFAELGFAEDSLNTTASAPASAAPASDSFAWTQSELAMEPEEPDAPEIGTVLPGMEPTEIRAAVETAVFLSPAVPVERQEATAPEARVDELAAPEMLEAPVPVAIAREEAPKAKVPRFLTAEDPYGEVAPPRERLRVAILGASGIGKNHARWFARHSCDVVSFLGSNEESVELTHSHLHAHMGFTGQGYSDLGRLLSETQPQAVCIASPPHLHYAQAIQCLEAGVHVLCEKPLVYAPGRSKRENADGARELLKAAARRNLVLGTQLQYGAATPILCRLAGVSPFEVGDFAMEIETTNIKSPRDPRELWVDLASHPLSVAQYLAGDGAEIVPETLQLFPSRSAYTSEVSARFGVRCEGGRLLMCRVIVRWFDKIVDNREPRRRFSFNGRVVQYSGVKSPDGTYIAQYVAPDGYISHYSDPVDYLIGNFVRTCWEEDHLILSAEQGVQNLDWLLATLEKL